jgi:hypothetical protein
MRIDPDPPVPIGEKLEWAIHEIIFFYLGKATVLLLTRPLSASSSSRRRGSEWSPCCADNGSLRRSDRLPSMLLTTKAAAVTVLGATGLGFSLLGPFLAEEEMADVSLATFHLLDKENVGSGVQLAARGGCRGCAARGCRGCAVRACAVGCAAGSCCASWGYCHVC